MRALVQFYRIFFTLLGWLTKAIYWLARFLLSLILTAIIALWVGVPTACHRMATQWLTKVIVEVGLTQATGRFLYYLFYGNAFLAIVAGWIMLAHLTVWGVSYILLKLSGYA
jgi:hypothetical protein